MVPNLPFIMQELLNLTNEIDIDTLANVMEEFVEVFAEQLTPFAVQLCTQLVRVQFANYQCVVTCVVNLYTLKQRDTFLRIMEDVTSAQNQAVDDALDFDEMGDKTMAAMGVLKTIGTLILSLESTPEMLLQLENALLPVITYTLENTIIGKHDRKVDLDMSLLFYCC